MSVQFYVHDEDEMKAYEVFKASVEPFRLSVASMYANFDADPNIGQVMRDANVVPLSNVVQPSLFKRIWGEMIRMIQDWGADQVLEFITSVYGIQVEITVDPPMNIGLVANIEPSETVDELWVTNNKHPAVHFEDTDYILAHVSPADFYVLFKRMLGDILSIEQLKILLQHLRPAGERWSVRYRS
jgi:hypothetical protein